MPPTALGAPGHQSMTLLQNDQGYKLIPTDDPTDNEVKGVPTAIHESQRSSSQSIGTATRSLAPEPTSMWRFVDNGWFQGVSAFIIIANIVTMIVEADNPTSKHVLFIPDQLMLTFYIIELVSRACYFRHNFLLGPANFVIWNVMDFLVVAAGIVDQWMMPFLPTSLQRGQALKVVLGILRLPRLFRVLKIIRIFLQSDLSWTEEPKFQSFMGVVIAFNALLMGMETDIGWGGWFFIEQVLLSIYVFELSVQLKRFGLYFLSCYNSDIIWNTLDFTIVVSSVTDSWIFPLIGLVLRKLGGDSDHSDGKKQSMSTGQVMMLMRMLRLMRILRLVKLVKSVRPLYVLVSGVLAALQGVFWVLVLTITVLYAMGILATRLIGHGMLFPEGHVPEDILFPFETVPDSMFTLFRVMSGAASDDESQALDQLMVALPTVKFAFVFFMITSSWTLLSILTAVVSENMISTTNTQEEERKLESADEERAEHIAELMELFREIDESGDNLVNASELDQFLANDKNKVRTARKCKVPVRDVKEVFTMLLQYNEEVKMGEFVEFLVDVGGPAPRKDVMRLEAKLEAMQRELKSTLRDIKEEQSLARRRLDEVHSRLQVREEHSEIALDRIREQQAAAKEILSEFRDKLHAKAEHDPDVQDRCVVDGLARLEELFLRERELQTTRALALQAAQGDLVDRLVALRRESETAAQSVAPDLSERVTAQLQSQLGTKLAEQISAELGHRLDMQQATMCPQCRVTGRRDQEPHSPVQRTLGEQMNSPSSLEVVEAYMPVH